MPNPDAVLIEYDPAKATVLWYVVFTPMSANMAPWWVRLWMRRDCFKHVYAFRDYAGITLTVNHVAQGLLVDASPISAPDTAHLLGNTDGNAVVLFAGRLKSRYTPRGAQTCVSVVKSLIGLMAWHIWTPDQLYRYLLNNNGVLIWEAKRAK